jgi:type III secretory pathway component EscT
MLLWLLIAARVAPVALLSPLLGGALVPKPIQLGLGAGLVALVAIGQPLPLAAEVAALPTAALIAIAAKEAIVGAVLAVLVAIPIGALEGAGRAIDLARGDSGEDRTGMLDGMTSPLGALLGMAALVTFFGIGGHLVVIRSLAGSYETLPMLAAPSAPLAVVGAAASLLGAALALALPALLAGLVVELAVAATQRAGGLPGRMIAGDVGRHLAALVVLGVGLTALAVGAAGYLRAALLLVTDALAA